MTSADVITLLTADHAALEQRFDEFELAPGERWGELFGDVMASVLRHELAEEAVVYPLLEAVPGGALLVRARLGEQLAAERQLARMEKLDPMSERFAYELASLESILAEHARYEEDEAFPLLVRTRSVDGLVALGRRYQAVKQVWADHATASGAPVWALAWRVRVALRGQPGIGSQPGARSRPA
jgi:hemerythrin superfamily protein